MRLTKRIKIAVPPPQKNEMDKSGRLYSMAGDGITQGLLATFMTCRKKAQFAVYRWSPIEFSVPLTFGDIAHQLLERAYYAVRDGEVDGLPDEHWCIENIKQIEEVQVKSGTTRLGKKHLEELEKICCMLEAVMPRYFQFWGKTSTFAGAEWLDLETDFRVNFGDTWLRGKFDGVFQLKGAPWLFETKTKAQIVEADLVQQLQFDFQTNVYLWALKKITGKTPKGVLYNIIRRPSLRIKDGEPLPKFRQRILEDIDKRPEHYFHRFQISIIQQDLDEFAKELDVIVGDFREWYLGRTCTYRNTSACFSKWKCRYLPICSQGNYQGFFQRSEIYPELESD